MHVMDRAVKSWEEIRDCQNADSRTKLVTMLDIIEPAVKHKDYEFLDNFLIQVEPHEMPTQIIALLRTTFQCHRHLIAWDQLRDRTWNMNNSKAWRHAMRGLDPKNCRRYSDFLANGGYAGVREALGV